jgi:SOS response regulatory protein OraA/RecX
VESVLRQLVEQNLLDDARFAQAWCREQLRRKPVGRRWLRSGLRDQGIPEDSIEEALDAALSREEEEEACRRALASRRYSLDDEKARARAHRFLLSRGFPENLARETVFRAHGESGGGSA